MHIHQIHNAKVDIIYCCPEASAHLTATYKFIDLN